MATCTRPDSKLGIADERISKTFSLGLIARNARLIFAATAALLPIAALAQLGNTAWPKFLGGAQNTSQGQGQGATNIVKWTFTAQGPVYTSPSLGADGTVYVGSDDFNVYALDPATGNVKWTFPTQSYVESSPAVGADGTIYVGSDDNNLYALNGSTGAMKWSFATSSFIDASPAIGSDGTVYIGSTDGNVYAINGSTGALVWTFATQGAVESSAAIGADGTVYVGSDDGNVYALNGKTGALKWSYTLTVPIFNSPSVGADGTVYVGADAIYALVGNATVTPTLKWTFNYGYDITSPIAISSTGYLVVATADGQVRYMTAAAGDVQWYYQSSAGLYDGSATIGADGTIYLASDAGILSAVSSTGSELWNYSASGEVYGASPVIGANGTLYVGGLSGNLTAFQSLTPTGLIITPGSLAGGNSPTGTVTLNLATPVPLNVSLTSSSPDATVPSSVTIPAGATTASFSISTNSVTKSENITISAAAGGATLTATLTLLPPAITSVSFGSNSITGGTIANGTVTLNGPAPTNGIAVNLKSSAPNYVNVPAVVYVTAGKTSVAFQAGSPAVTASHSATITATYGSVSETTELTVNPATLSELSLNYSSVAGGTTVAGTVSITGPAGAAVTIKLASSLKGVTVPPSVVIAKGKSVGTFTVHTVAVSALSTATITASIGTSSLTAQLSVTPPSLASVTFASKSVVGGLATVGTVKLTGPAGVGGMSITLASSTQATAVATTVKIPQGLTAVTFQVKTTPVATDTPSTITASLNSETATGTLTVMAPTLRLVSLSPASLKGGKTSTATVTISSAAPASGLIITLSSSAPDSAIPPATLVIPGGKLSGTFKITTSAVTSTTVATITAAVNASTKTAKLTIL